MQCKLAYTSNIHALSLRVCYPPLARILMTDHILLSPDHNIIYGANKTSFTCIPRYISLCWGKESIHLLHILFILQSPDHNNIIIYMELTKRSLVSFAYTPPHTSLCWGKGRMLSIYLECTHQPELIILNTAALRLA